MVYGHYDVQPAEKEDGWKTQPFDLYDDGKRLYGRGASDNKGQILTHITGVLSLKKSKNLKYNVKFLIEGNEETSNDDLAGIMLKNKKAMACDVVLISDGELTNNRPTVEVSLRGGFNCLLTYKTGKNNLHSGIAGGAVPNSAIELSKLIAKLYNSDGTITYKDFYKSIDKISDSQLKNNKMLAREAGDTAKLFGVKALLMPKNTDYFTQTGLSATIQVTGFKAGYIGNGFSNIVPAESEVRLNFRLASSQDPKLVIKSFESFVKKNTPNYVEYKLSYKGIHSPIKVSTDNMYVKKAEEILSSVYKTNVNKRNVGGALPIVADIKNVLKVDTLLAPLVNEDCNMHGVNENYDLSLAKKGLEFSLKFFSS
jgi:acetylornithine deacetylase/succinyl-diaminopimelate desuccinylase-like protein